MPLLPLEPFIFPDDLLSGPRLGMDDGQPWWVLHTRPRAEKALARRLFSRQTSFFLPLYKRQWRTPARTLSSYLPLFPGYLFLRGDADIRRQALETNLVATYLIVGDQARLWDDLARVYALMVSGSPLSPEEQLHPGARIEIVSGPLQGLQGKIIRHGNQLRFFVEVDFLQKGASVEIESWMFRALGQAESAGTLR